MVSRTTYIVGAGLSHYAGLPLQSEFTKAILAARDYKSGPSLKLVRQLESFVREVFSAGSRDAWPDLEDVFTFIDSSANTGHHFGAGYSPSDLRRIRRVLIARTFRMLHRSYEKAKKKSSRERKLLTKFLQSIQPATSSFISLNWDTSLEAVMEDMKPRRYFSYGPGIDSAEFCDTKKIRKLKHRSATIQIAKMHGSMNWLYCDNCRRVFWFPPDDTLLIANQIVRKEEWERIQPGRRNSNYRVCCYCKKVELSTRIATFSYRKALDFPMFQRSWMLAERNLRRSERWVFIGYSLPAADFEFKYLLKRVELACKKRPGIVVISGGKDVDALRRTLRNYQGLFGSQVRDGSTFRPEGLTVETIRQIT